MRRGAELNCVRKQRMDSVQQYSFKLTTFLNKCKVESVFSLMNPFIVQAFKSFGRVVAKTACHHYIPELQRHFAFSKHQRLQLCSNWYNIGRLTSTHACRLSPFRHYTKTARRSPDPALKCFVKVPNVKDLFEFTVLSGL